MNIFAELCCFSTPKNLFLNKNISDYLAPNFREMINELKEFYEMTAEKIAFLLPVSNASTVSEWGDGGVPNYDNGNAFIGLWKYLTGKSEKEIPRINRYLIVGEKD